MPAVCRDVDGPRDRQREQRKTEREKQVSYINTCMWNLEKRYRWSYLQSRNRDAGAENKCTDTKGGRGEEWTGRLELTYTRACSVVYDSVTPWTCSPPGSSVRGISQARILGVGCHFLLQGIFQTQESNPSLPWLLTGRRILEHWATLLCIK